MSRRPRTISDPRELAGLVLATPGLIDKLADSLTELGSDIATRGIERKDLHATLVRSLVKLAEEWPGVYGWAVDNAGEPYPYKRP